VYEAYWNLSTNPFKNTPDTRFFYFSRQHEEALTRLLYTITEDKGAMVLTGEYGCGKTLLSRALLEHLDPERYDVALLPHPNLRPVEFLQEILHQFGCRVSDVENKGELLRLLQELLKRNHARGRSTLILVDEAQMVHEPGTLEEIRVLLNFQLDESFLLTLILIGQPELRDTLEAMPQLSQRLAMRYHLHALSDEHSHQYIRHRLQVAGATHEVFTSGAESLLVEHGQGIPRQMNNLADMALMVGFGQKAPVVDEKILRQVAATLEL
jgi:general secretion pathway protein A